MQGVKGELCKTYFGSSAPLTISLTDSQIHFADIYNTISSWLAHRCCSGISRIPRRHPKILQRDIFGSVTRGTIVCEQYEELGTRPEIEEPATVLIRDVLSIELGLVGAGVPRELIVLAQIEKLTSVRWT